MTTTARTPLRFVHLRDTAAALAMVALNLQLAVLECAAGANSYVLLIGKDSAALYSPCPTVKALRFRAVPLSIPMRSRGRGTNCQRRAAKNWRF